MAEAQSHTGVQTMQVFDIERENSFVHTKVPPLSTTTIFYKGI
jgi:hypothetical protein